MQGKCPAADKLLDFAQQKEQVCLAAIVVCVRTRSETRSLRSIRRPKLRGRKTKKKTKNVRAIAKFVPMDFFDASV
jgi:hypothetical protein